MDWDKLRIFQAVADAGSFTHAGETLKLSQSAISRQIGALEEQLGVMLFHRHARGLILDRAGRAALSHRARHGRQGQHRRALLRANQDKPAGRLKVHDHGRLRLDLADRADARIHHHVSRHRRQPGAVGQRARSRHARGRCRHPHGDAAPARAGAAPSADGAQPRLCLARLHPEVRQADHRSRNSTSTA